MLRLLLLIALMSMMLIVGCDKSSDSPPPESNPDSAYLLGLNRDHQLHYVVYDSIVKISFDESDTVIYDTTEMDIGITRGQNNQVEFSVNSLPHDLLTIDELGILHSGQIRLQATPPDTLFFYPTPMIMPRTFFRGNIWYIDSPPFTTETGEIERSLLYFNYGYFTERTFVGRENVVLPTGSYNAYHFQSYLFSDEKSFDTLMAVNEYYSPGIGPVKIVVRLDRSRRLILLLEDE